MPEKSVTWLTLLTLSAGSQLLLPHFTLSLGYICPHRDYLVAHKTALSSFCLYPEVQKLYLNCTVRTESSNLYPIQTLKLTCLSVLHFKDTLLKPSNHFLYVLINFTVSVSCVGIVVSKHGLGNMGLGLCKLPKIFSCLLPTCCLFQVVLSGDLENGKAMLEVCYRERLL